MISLPLRGMLSSMDASSRVVCQPRTHILLVIHAMNVSLPALRPPLRLIVIYGSQRMSRTHALLTVHAMDASLSLFLTGLLSSADETILWSWQIPSSLRQMSLSPSVDVSSMVSS
ncbi:hypothetical protein QCA50_012309 [Cerrena zonata]|uniref:Uncharacterized protein n=1 Tax=Cerrena zonata TaxID=2478898 RepID=A0AAW0FYG7_9APHY